MKPCGPLPAVLAGGGTRDPLTRQVRGPAVRDASRSCEGGDADRGGPSGQLFCRRSLDRIACQLAVTTGVASSRRRIRTAIRPLGCQGGPPDNVPRTPGWGTFSAATSGPHSECGMTGAYSPPPARMRELFRAPEGPLRGKWLLVSPHGKRGDWAFIIVHAGHGRLTKWVRGTPSHSPSRRVAKAIR